MVRKMGGFGLFGVVFKGRLIIKPNKLRQQFKFSYFEQVIPNSKKN
ncbi:hypothetical protein BSPWISOXPB_6536 [uncultured Gammaproteobacteria bacterium]|nr:hypothetical protein BSPWISOXPB_6536 [uncultured Gammaproteobacteria bacterium]